MNRWDPWERKKLPWYAWPLIPLVLPGVLLVFVPLSILALFSIPYFGLYPERHWHMYDFEATTRQRELLARWRALYAELGFYDRVARAIKRWRRRMRGRPFRLQARPE